MNDYLLGCDVLGDDLGNVQIISGANVEAPIFLSDDLIKQIEVEVVGDAEIIGRGGGRGGGSHRHHGGGRSRPWGPGWWGGYGPWYPEYYEVEPLTCVRYDKDGNCLEYAPVIEVVGAYDFGAEQRKMNELKTVPVSVAQALVRGARKAIDGAIAGAKQPWYKPDLPGQTARQIALGKVQWHETALKPLVGNPNATYPHGDDLKSWTMAAFREANAVETGAAYIDSAWKSMWSEIAVAVKNLPAEVRKTVGDSVRIITGLPVWAWALIGTGALLVVGGIVYAIINSKSGAAVSHAIAKKYL